MFYLIKTFFSSSAIALIIIFLMSCTILQFSQNWLRRNNVNSKIIPILVQFSLFNSSLRILNTKVNSESIPVIHGIRALSILWVVYGHEIYFNFTASYFNLTDFLDVSFSFIRPFRVVCAIE